jgi:hypothetical protein
VPDALFWEWDFLECSKCEAHCVHEVPRWEHALRRELKKTIPF